MKKYILSILTIILGAFLFVPAPVFAACPEGTVPVSILGNEDNIVIGTNGEKCLKDDGEGGSIINILKLVVDIMTIGVGILGVIGISIVGIQYLTAGGNEEKARKAKRRLFEIVIGLVAYAVFYAILIFLNINQS